MVNSTPRRLPSPPTTISGLVPLAILEGSGDGRRLADVLTSTGIGLVEVALRTRGAADAAAELIAHGGLSVGLGTVIVAEQVQLADSLNASFVVSPGFVGEVADASIDIQMPYIPGVATPTEGITARAAGFDLLKVYPVHALGGLALIEALSAVLPHARFMPSGGVSSTTAADYLAHPAVAAVSGSWMIPKQLIVDQNWSGIARLCRDAQELARAAGEVRA
ncbi:bifunctional 4-hydroxy-2-oxoglutarate aldolase/2-dehydro-3-deoxy-phosphogluconate aldolase [Leifsonia sp. AG29]|uniref:bifunctional 4-hydroxy-2-oxoglutarate aldolase/2-dehydro-3-deoxy-phosphogluconate aldolase n=1 Tax=Leifsonia sp. AG29 TaxID=2598860 RepID=UPI00131CDA85|nr:bifunctional 4-hydroxy-2-oxoglutarate aldolase/2-dehydro-3-deoxy-phosphogluconate aldolase [Leifsonia sp. AG29]